MPMDSISSNLMDWPEDIVVEILSRVPHKSALRFKVVSKSWLNMISNSMYERNFTKIMSGLFYSYLVSSSNNTSFLSLPASDRKAYYDLDFLPSNRSLRVKDCCNGLVLCELSFDGLLDQEWYVCNPATKRWAALPLPESRKHFGKHQMALAFDPKLSSHFHVIYFPELDSRVTTLMMFSSSSQTWEDFISLDWMPCDGADKCPGVFLNGYFFLLDRRHFIIRIDIKRKKSRVIPVPMVKNQMFKVLQKSGDDLLYIMLGYDSKMHVQIFNKNLDRLIWKQSVVDLRPVMENLKVHHRMSCNDLGVSAVHLDLELVFFRVDNKLFSFHLRTGQVQEIWCFSEEWRQLEFFSYSPCLSSML